MEFPASDNYGVFEYFRDTYKQPKTQYTFYANLSGSKQYSSEYAFDGTSSYWWAGESIPYHVELSFSLIGRSIKLTHYSIKTSSQNCRPQSFEFVASRDNKTWYEPSIDSNPMSVKEVRMNEYNVGISQYFKLISTGYISHSACLGYGMDVDEIELFGTLFDDLSLLARNTCMTFFNPKFYIFFIDYFLVFK